jgi:hypothetical protein
LPFRYRGSRRESAVAQLFSLGISALWTFCMDKYQSYRKLLNAQTEAAITQTLLDELRSGRIANALELLEQQLDSSILSVHRFIGEVEPAERTTTIAMLRKFRQYRLRHPRKTEAVFDSELQKDDLATHEMVRKILDETPDA